MILCLILCRCNWAHVWIGQLVLMNIRPVLDLYWYQHWTSPHVLLRYTILYESSSFNGHSIHIYEHWTSPCATAVGHIFSVSEPNTHHHHLAHLEFGYENAQVHHSRTSSHCSNIKMMNVHQYLPWWKQKNIFHVLFLSIEVMEGSASLSFPNIGHHPHHISHDHVFDQLINGWKC